MGEGPTRLSSYVRLGRVSNLPTVWTNVLAGTVVADGDLLVARTICTLIALSLYYTGGMFLNDALDARFDARFRPERPIPSGALTRREVLLAGTTQLAVALLLLILSTRLGGSGSTAETAVWGVVLGTLIVYYDARHRDGPGGPLVMGLCRLAVYGASAAVARTALSTAVMVPALVLAVYVAGLTIIATNENVPSLPGRWPVVFMSVAPVYAVVGTAATGSGSVFGLLFLAWVVFAARPLVRGASPNVRVAVVQLIAGIAIFDGAVIAAYGRIEVAAVAVGAFVLTLVLQRFVAGT